MKHRWTLLSLLALTLTACSAGKVNTSSPETQPYAPVNNTAEGDVRYLNAGAKVVRDARRDDAYKKMYAHCGGPYEIVREEDEDTSLLTGSYRRIWFKCVGAGASFVPTTSSPAELKRYVERAAQLVQTQGVAAACAAFHEPRWKAGEYYVFVNSADTNVSVCHPVRDDLVGQDQTDLQDANGKYIVREMRAAAGNAEGKGWVDYVWPRPGEPAPEKKATFVIGVTGPDGKRYVVGSGAYGVVH